MIVNVNTKSIVQINIESEEAFRILCETLHMDFVLDEDTEYFVHKDSNGNNCVYKTIRGHEKCVDDRGDLFVALRNVAVNMFLNLGYRSADYIYKS